MKLDRAQLLVAAKEAATLLAISERTLWQLTHDGRLPVIRFGRIVRYDPVDLRAFIEAGRCVGNTQ